MALLGNVWLLLRWFLIGSEKLVARINLNSEIEEEDFVGIKLE